ncbi:hypothetical protein B0H12DRAFT_1101023 [Mycena haematopus]|nr:hypothetical protein B0H12DRAFT_1101023 [Mycena haematopus]
MDDVFVRYHRQTDLEGIRRLLFTRSFTDKNNNNRTVATQSSYLLGGLGLGLVLRAGRAGGRWSYSGILLCLLGRPFAHALDRQYWKLCSAIQNSLVRPEAPGALLLAARYDWHDKEAEGEVLGEIVGICKMDQTLDQIHIQHLSDPKWTVSASSLLVDRVLQHSRMLGINAVILTSTQAQEQERIYSRIQFESLKWRLDSSTNTGSWLAPQTIQIYKLRPSSVDPIHLVRDIDPSAYNTTDRTIFLTLDTTTLTALPHTELPHTERLLCAVSRSIQSLTTGEGICRVFEYTFTSICVALERDRPDFFMDAKPSCSIAQFIAREGTKTCVTTYLDKPWTGMVDWGITNRKVEEADRYGLLMPAINGGLVLQYEEMCRDPGNNFEVQSMLAFLIILTYLHELCHAWLRDLFKDVLPDDWNTPPQFEGQDGESGRALETSLLGGELRASWHDGENFHPKRFLKLRGLWIGPSQPGLQSPLREIDKGQLQNFRQRVLGTAPFNIRKGFADLIRTKNPETSTRLKLDVRGALLRASSAPIGSVFSTEQAHSDRTVVAACGLERERLGQRASLRLLRGVTSL